MGRRIRSRTVRTRAVFKPEDPDAIVVLRLAAAATDIGTLLRMVIDMLEKEKSGERSSAEAHGTRRYAFRMAMLHLDEIKKIVNRDLGRLVKRYGQRQTGYARALTEQSAILREKLNTPGISQVIGRCRDHFGGHYDPEVFADSLRKIDTSELTELPGRGVHYNVVDRLFDIALVEVSSAHHDKEDAIKSVQWALNGVFDLQSPLFGVVHALVAAMHVESEGL